MRAGEHDVQISVEKKVATQDGTYGTEVISWEPLVAEAGSPVVAVRWWAQIQDALPSRSEAVTQDLVMRRNQSRLRMRYRNDITSDMRVTVYRDDAVVYQIVGGPALIGGRKERIEMVLERYSS